MFVVRSWPHQCLASTGHVHTYFCVHANRHIALQPRLLLVADFHRNLLMGGIFFYPGQMGMPNGKLRLLYEAGPLAFVAQQAGGYASDGQQPILDLTPSTLHQRVPVYVGNYSLVRKAETFIRELDGNN